MEAEPSPAPTEPVSFSQAEPVDADNAGVVACSGDKRKMSFDSVEMSLERPKGFVLAWYLGNVVSELGMVQCSLRSAIFAAEARKANGDDQMEFYADVARDSLEGVAEVMKMAKTGALLEHGEAHENALKEYLLREIVGEREDADVQAGIGMLGGMPEFGEMFESHAESIGRYAEDLQVALWDFKRLEVATGLKKCKAVGKVALKSHALPFGTLVTWFCQGTEGLPAVVVPGPLAGLEKGGVFACALLGVVNLKHPVSVELELDDYGRTWEFGFEFEGSGVDSQTVELYKLRCVLEKAKALAKEGAKIAQGAERVETYSCKVHKAYHNKVKAFVGEKGRGVVKTKADWVVLYAAGNGTVGEHLKCKPALQAAVDAVIVGELNFWVKCFLSVVGGILFFNGAEWLLDRLGRNCCCLQCLQ